MIKLAASDTTYSQLEINLTNSIVKIFVNDFTQSSAKLFYESFNNALTTGQKIIPVIIDSYGGSVDALVTMMEMIKSSPLPVATIAVGKAMSCGSFLLSCGTEGMRYIAPNSRVMIHHISSVSWGKMEDIKVETIEIERMQKLVFEMMDKNCGRKKNYFLNILKQRGNTDWYLTPQECLKHNLVNHIKMPTLKTKIIVENILV